MAAAEAVLGKPAVFVHVVVQEIPAVLAVTDLTVTLVVQVMTV
jgi:hypothetical protein